MTITNALASAISISMKPNTTNWADPGKQVAHAVWTATGYASIALLAAWAVVYLLLRLRGDISARAGFALALVHAAAWTFLPSWS